MQETKHSGKMSHRGFRSLWPSCRDVSRLQSVLSDQPLPVAKRIGLRLHLLVCSWCRRYGKQIGFLREAAQQSTETAPAPPALSLGARERMRRALEDTNK